MGKLTTLSNRAEVDWRTGIDGEWRSSAGSVMVATAGRPNFGRETAQSRSGREEWKWGDERVAGAAPAAALLELSSTRTRGRRKGGGARIGIASG